MLNSPQTITISGVAADLNKVRVNPTSSEYTSVDGSLEFIVSHQETKTRKRHMVKISKTIVAADPLTAVNLERTASVHVVFDEPIVGFTDADLDAIAAGFITWLSSANRLIVLSGRH